MYNDIMVKRGAERSVIRELFEYGNRRKAEIGGENVFDFSIGNPSVPSPREVEAFIRTDTGGHGYTSAPGLPAVRKAVSDYIQTSFGVPMSEDLVYMTCGASASIVIALTAVIEPGEEVIVPAPYFPEYAVFLEEAGGVLVPVPTDEKFHLDVDAIRCAITERTRAVLINSPNNPTGAVYSEEEMFALGNMLAQFADRPQGPVLLLADEPYRELTYGAAPVYPMRVYDHTVVLYSFSKSLSLAGERIGYIAVSPKCREAARLFEAVCGAGRRHGYVCAPALFQRAVTGSLGQCAGLEVYRANRDLLYTSLSDMGYTCIVPEGAFYLFVRALEPDSAAFSERAKRHELLLVPSHTFGVEGYVRISYCVERSVIERSLPAFAALMEEYRAAK